MDDEIRSLEHEVAASGSADARLRLASALDRAGRSSEAVAALLPAAANSAVRRRLAMIPAWTQWGGNAGHTSELAVAPILTRPRLRWTRDFEPTLRELMGGPLGLVATSVSRPDDDAGRSVATLILDPETGQERFSVPGDHHQRLPVVFGDLVLAPTHASLYAGHDLQSGERRFTVGGDEALLLHDRVLVTRNGDRIEGVVLDGTLRVPPIAPRLAELGKFTKLLAAGGNLIVTTEENVTAVSLETGAVQWRAGERVFARHTGMTDAAGGLVDEIDNRPRRAGARAQRRTWLYDSAGAVGHTFEGPQWPMVLTSRWVVTTRSHGEERMMITRVDRQSGEELPLLEVDSIYDDVTPFAAARDVLYLGFDGAITAISLQSGETLWRFEGPQDDRYADGSRFWDVLGLVPAHGRLYVLVTHHALFCLEEP